MSASKCFIYRLLATTEGREKRLRMRLPSSPSSSSFNPVQSISRVRTARQSLMNLPASSRFYRASYCISYC
jgi:hypothetical protein